MKPPNAPPHPDPTQVTADDLNSGPTPGACSCVTHPDPAEEIARDPETTADINAVKGALVNEIAMRASWKEAGKQEAAEEIARLREAAEPFRLIADFYDTSPVYTRVDQNDVVVIVRPNGEAFHLTYQHCAAMREAMGGKPANYDAALAGSQQPAQGEGEPCSSEFGTAMVKAIKRARAEHLAEQSLAAPPHPDPAEEIARLREALTDLIGRCEYNDVGFPDAIARARAALAGSSPARGEGK
jgi:hypothetical protein